MRRYDGVVLYGPPASGKDTITQELVGLDAAYVHFAKLKAGTGRTAGYRLSSAEELDALRAKSQLIHEITRYGATYAVDTPHLDELLKAGLIPIVHMGQLAGVDALQRHSVRWLDVLLWCPRDVTEQRLRQRGSSDVARRLVAWDETLADLTVGGGEPRFTLALRTDALPPTAAAGIIHRALIS